MPAREPALDRRERGLPRRGYSAAAVMRDCGWQPQKIIRTAGSHTSTVFGVPPMLHGALCELARGGGQDRQSSQTGRRIQHRHRILQLIAEAEGAAGLIECRPRPHPAAQCPVLLPAVQQHVDRKNWSTTWTAPRASCPSASYPVVLPPFPAGSASSGQKGLPQRGVVRPFCHFGNSLGQLLSPPNSDP